MMIDFVIVVIGMLSFTALIWEYQRQTEKKENEEKLERAGDLLRGVLYAVPSSHGILHALKVLKHAHSALEQCPKLTQDIKLAIMLAALLHDADDKKYFPKNKNYQNARQIVRKVYPDVEDLVIEMIGYVACSANGSSIP